MSSEDIRTRLVERLRDEADLCRNDGAGDIAKLLDESADRIEELEALLNEAFDLLGGVDGASELRGKILASEALEPEPPKG